MYIFGRDFTIEELIVLGVVVCIMILRAFLSVEEIAWLFFGSCCFVFVCIQEKQQKQDKKEAQEKAERDQREAQEKEEREQREVYSGFCQHCGRKRTLLKKIRTEYYQSAYVYVCPRHGI